MPTKTRSIRISDSYLGLIQRFPVRPIRSDAEYRAAMRLNRELMRRATVDDLDAGEGDYLEALTRFIIDYERARFLRNVPPATVAQKLRFLMEQRRMKPGDLGKILGYPSAASDILHGVREPSKAQIRKLAEYFNVSPALFL